MSVIGDMAPATPGALYRDLPNAHSTRIIRVLDATPQQPEKLLLQLSVLDLNNVPPPSDEISDTHIKDSDYGAYDYKALSYTWGAPISTPESQQQYSAEYDVSVTVETEHAGRLPFRIGRNLYDALSHIYARGDRIPIWVDAICINQDDLIEKSTHVLLMCEIYTKAKQVVIWLGVDDVSDPQFDDILWLHAELYPRLVSLRDPSSFTLPQGVFSQKIAEDCTCVTLADDSEFIVPNDRLRSLFRFCAQRRYFGRAWIVQEVALCPDSYTLLGDHLIDFSEFSMLPGMIGTMDGNIARVSDDTIHGQRLSVIAASAIDIQNWNHSPTRAFLKTTFGSDDDYTTFLAMMLYLVSVGAREASDPRDHIYSLLGMVQAVVPVMPSPVTPDYLLSADEVFTRFTAQVLLHLPFPSILSLVADKVLHTQYVELLPSWVPDFATARTLSNALLFAHHNGKEYPSYRAGNFASPSSLRIEGGELVVHARRCALIERHFSPCPGMASTNIKERAELMDCLTFQTLFRAFGEIEARNVNKVISSTLYTISPRMEASNEEDFFALWNQYLCKVVLVATRFPSQDTTFEDIAISLCELFAQCEDHPAVPTHHDLLKTRALWNLSTSIEMYQGLEQFEDMMEQQFEKLQRLWPEFDIWRDDEPQDGSYELLEQWGQSPTMDVSNLHRFFITEDRIVGVGYSALQSGDEVWLISQAQTPFILRPAASGNYHLVGEVFVPGMMKGEYIDNDWAEKICEIRIV